jgi:hypothetical protein
MMGEVGFDIIGGHNGVAVASVQTSAARPSCDRFPRMRQESPHTPADAPQRQRLLGWIRDSFRQIAASAAPFAVVFERISRDVPRISRESQLNCLFSASHSTYRANAQR